MSSDRILVPRLHRGTVAGPDGISPGSDAAQLRSERVGNPDEPGDGRAYHIDFSADDGRGGECSSSVAFCVTATP